MSRENPRLTVFTPVYNRAEIIKNLFHSLMQQTNKHFEWLIVDDGSIDDIQSTIDFINKNADFPCRFYSKLNGGKHTAINRGVELAGTELFLIIDSDDMLVPSAVETVLADWQQYNISNNAKLAGLGYNRIRKDGTVIGGERNYDILQADYIDYHYRLHHSGDKSEVYKTSVLKSYPFPGHAEKFCPEALIWRRIGEKFDLMYINKGICVCEYLAGGLTDKITSLRIKSPVNTVSYYEELMNDRKATLAVKIKACINFWRFKWHLPNHNQERFRILPWSWLLFPLGWMLMLMDLYKIKK